MISLHFFSILNCCHSLRGLTTCSPRSLFPLKFCDTDLLTVLEISYYIGYSVHHPITDVIFLLTTQELQRHKLDVCFQILPVTYRSLMCLSSVDLYFAQLGISLSCQCSFQESTIVCRTTLLITLYFSTACQKIYKTTSMPLYSQQQYSRENNHMYIGPPKTKQSNFSWKYKQ